MEDMDQDTEKPDWEAILAEEMIREEIEKEDGRYLVYYRFQAKRES